MLGNLGAEKAWVVHGSDGLDELTTTGPSTVAALQDGKVTTFEVSPDDAGLAIAKPADLLGGDGDFNAKAMTAMLSGEASAFRDIVIFSAAAALIVADQASDLKEGAALAAESIDGGKARSALETMARITNEGT